MEVKRSNFWESAKNKDALWLLMSLKKAMIKI